MDDKKFPWNKKDKEPAPFEAVYAGPDFFNPPQIVRGAYAPPQAQTPPPVPKDDPNAKYCPQCGSKVLETSRFCPECGAVLPQAE